MLILSAKRLQKDPENSRNNVYKFWLLIKIIVTIVIMQGYKIFAIPKVAFHSIYFLFFFLAIFLKRKLEKLHEIFVVPRLFFLLYSIFPKFSNQLCHRGEFVTMSKATGKLCKFLIQTRTRGKAARYPSDCDRLASEYPTINGSILNSI